MPSVLDAEARPSASAPVRPASAAGRPEPAAWTAVRGRATLGKLALRRCADRALTGGPTAPVRHAVHRAAATGLLPVPDQPEPLPVYRLREHDTPERVATAWGVGLRTLLAANGLPAGRPVPAGRVMVLPLREAAHPRTHARRPAPGILAAAGANRSALAVRPVPTRSAARALVAETALALHVPPGLALAVALLESGFDQRTVSPANAVGIMQLTPSAARWAAGLHDVDLDPLDAEDNVTAGTTLLAVLLAGYPQSLALAGYAQGLDSVRRHGPDPQTRRFVAAVRLLAPRFG